MTARARDAVLDDVTFTVYRRGTALAELGSIEPIYASAYTEAPYNEGPEDVAEFSKGWPSRVAQPSFRLVVARIKAQPVGFTFGHQLTAATRWWSGMLDDVDDDITVERQGRTFAVSEIAVNDRLRNQGIGRELHSYLLAGLTEERATLLVRSEATAAQCAYYRWAYEKVGRLQPFTDGPVYESMIKKLHNT